MDKELEKRLDGMEDRLSAKIVDSVEASEKRLATTISDVVTLIDNRFNKVDKRFEQVDVRFERIEEHLSNIDEKLDPLVNQVSNQEKRLSFIEEKVL